MTDSALTVFLKAELQQVLSNGVGRAALPAVLQALGVPPVEQWNVPQPDQDQADG
jgi:hypothetical protein